MWVQSSDFGQKIYKNGICKSFTRLDMSEIFGKDIQLAQIQLIPEIFKCSSDESVPKH